MDRLLYYIPAFGLAALFYAFFLVLRILKQPKGTVKMQEISGFIQRGAMAFLYREYRVIVPFAIIVFVLIWWKIGIGTAISFISGALSSALAGFFGMYTAVRANVRTAHAAREGQNKALAIAFSGGSVMGMLVVGLGLLGLSIIYIIFKDISIVTAFGLGASSIALFARVGGGIYTKAADVGADLVGKVEKGIPEDDPRNPAVIADNVGDNVGDVAGMGADLFESYVGSVISAITLGIVSYQVKGAVFALMIAGIGIAASIIGSFFVRGREGKSLSGALRIGNFVSTGLALIGVFFLSNILINSIMPAMAVVLGLVTGLLIGLLTEYYTSADYKPVREIAKQSETGAATNIIYGLAIGMKSTAPPIIVISACILGAFLFAGMFGIALAALGMLSTAGMTVALDAYGPIADNAGGIVEMSGLGDDVRSVTDKLDSVGNITAAIGKGFAIGSAALTALALFASYTQVVGLEAINLIDTNVIIGVFLGGMLPYLFSAITMQAVGKAAHHMIEEVRRQFKEIKGIMEGTAKPDYGRCVDISTRESLRQMVVPGLLALLLPIITGLLLGKAALGGLIAGSLITGVLVAIQMANSGGAWDNAKKYIEQGNNGGKGSPAHQAAVVGDTVGDPFKDTAGPSLNILIKLMAIVALVFGPFFL